MGSIIWCLSPSAFRYNGITSMAALQLSRLTGLRALFLQGKRCSFYWRALEPNDYIFLHDEGKRAWFLIRLMTSFLPTEIENFYEYLLPRFLESRERRQGTREDYRAHPVTYHYL